MPLFSYRALTPKGQTVSGIIDADTLQDATDKLQIKQLILIDMEKASKHQKKSKLSQKDLIMLFHGLSRLIEAGLPLYEALIALEEKFNRSDSGVLIVDLCDRIKSGSSLSQALAKHPESFDLLICSMVANAEKSGALSETLKEIADLLSKQKALKKQILSSLLYPSILLGFSFLVIGVLLFFVVPSLFELFEGRSLHPLTKFVLSCSQFLNSRKIELFSFVSILIGTFFFIFSNKKGRKRIFLFVFKLPFLKNIFAKTALVRFCRTFGSLLEGGVSYVEAVKLAASVTNHPALEKEIKEKATSLIEGRKLSDLFMESTLLPPLLARMLSIAEKSGDMPKMLYYLSKIYEEELEKLLSQITSMLQPIMLLILGAIVDFIVLSVLLPLTDVSSFI